MIGPRGHGDPQIQLYVLSIFGLICFIYFTIRLFRLRREAHEMGIRHAKERGDLAHRIALYRHMTEKGYDMPWLLNDRDRR